MYFFETECSSIKPMLISNLGQIVTYEDYQIYRKEIKKLTEPRKLVFLFCSNTCGSVLGYLSFLNNHIVPLLLDSKMDEEMVNNLIDIYEPDYLYYPERIAENMSVKTGEIIFCNYGYQLKRCMKTSETDLNEELALLLTTSGSTGSPKLVRQSYRNIQDNAESIAEYLQLNEHERPITTLPMQYTYGLSIINSHVLCGATILLTESTLFESEFWLYFAKQGASSFGGVPFTYEMLAKINFFSMNLPSLKTMTQAGGKLSESLHKEFAEYAKENGKKFIVMYGQTEATARMSYLPFEKTLEKIGSIGIAIPNGKFDIIDGELIYIGSNVTLGYAVCKADLKKGYERQGLLYTGDMARVDEDGYYYIVGRKKRFLKILGNRVNLDEVEQILKTEYHGIGIACAGVDNQMDIFVENNSLLSANEIIRFISGKMKLHPAVFRVSYIKEIPVNVAGKVQYGKLKVD